MSEPKNQQQMTVSLTDDNSRRELINTQEDVNSELPYQGTSYSGTLNLSRVAGELQLAIDEYIAGCRQHYEKLYGLELPVYDDNDIRQMLLVWNRCLQLKQGVWGTSAIVSLDIKEDINKFTEVNLLNGNIPTYIVYLTSWYSGIITDKNFLTSEQWTENKEEWIILWLQLWNKFLRAREGETLVTSCGMFFTVFGLFCYLIDQVSDICTSTYYGYKGQWWQALLTLALIYVGIIIHTVHKWLKGRINCTGTANWLRYISSLLVNWPDVKQYGELCRLEWQLYKSPENNARLVAEWHWRRLRVALLKFMEGICEACLQAILQLYLLVPYLYGDLTWTDYLRILSTCISLCSAGAALTNLEKRNRIDNYIDSPMCELIVLHVWAVPVTVSRLLSVALLLTVKPYWCLAGVTLHLILCSVYWCKTYRIPRALSDVLAICLFTLLFFISPFDITESVTYRCVLYAIHFLGNTVATVVWALGTPLACSHPALYTAIICFNVVMFVLGLMVWVLYKKYWPR